MNHTAVKALQERRSTRSFDPQRQVSEEDLRELLKVAVASPSARNRQLYHFSVVRDPALLSHMSELIIGQMLKGGEEQRGKASAPGYDPLYHAPTLVVVSGKLDASFYVQTDCGIAVGMLVAAAETMGLASCVIGSSLFMFDSDEGAGLKRTLQIPDDYRSVCSVALGYRQGDKPDPPEHKSPEELLTCLR